MVCIEQVQLRCHFHSQPELLSPSLSLVPAASLAPALSTQFDDLAKLIVTGKLPAALATAPASMPAQSAPVPEDLQSGISSRISEIFTSPVPAPEHRSEVADRRQSGQPTEDDMVVAEQLQGSTVPTAASLPYMRFRLRDKLLYWKQIGAPKMVLGWVEYGYMGTFWAEPPKLRKKNQQSCYEPQEQFDFVDSSVKTLLSRGVISEWQPEWGDPKVISPLKVVPKKPDTFRLMLDLSEMNWYLSFPKFKYDNIDQVRPG